MKFKLKLLFLIFLSSLISSCAIKERLQEKPQITMVEKPPELLWSDAKRFWEQKNYSEAALAFEEIEKQHPYSKLAKKGQMMSAYVYYLAKEYESSIFAIDRYISLHPADKQMAYMLYLKGLCHYDRIAEPRLDQNPSKLAKKNFEEIIKKFPKSKYAKDSKKKLFLINDQLAAQEMVVGRYYQKKRRHLAAIERFKAVVDNYNTTAQTPEALYRLTESYLSLGIIQEAKKTTAVLGYNYKNSNWYRLSYNLVKKYGYTKNEKS